jgi:Mitochondrial carrier protein
LHDRNQSAISMDFMACLQQGAVGAVGAIPGTITAHPLDLTKIRMQVDVSTNFQSAMRQTFNNGLFRGLVPGIQQKVMTRGPMFFCSEVCTQLCQIITGMSREKALWIGSFGSGYVTGFVASLAEWVKVQKTMGKLSTVRVRALQMARSSVEQGHTMSLLRRMRGAALRNAVFDSTFFGVEHGIRTGYETTTAVSFAVAAITALCVDYPIDVAVKRNFAKGPHSVVPHGPIMTTIQLIRTDWSRVYRGLGWKGMEFATSYSVAGVVAPVVAKGFIATAAMVVASSSLFPRGA